jgi:hypothetical protein
MPTRVVDDPHDHLSKLPAFKAFQNGIGERVDAPPTSADGVVVGLFGLGNAR